MAAGNSSFVFALVVQAGQGLVELYLPMKARGYIRLYAYMLFSIVIIAIFALPSLFF